jgi:flagellar motor switch protein FliN
MSEVERRDLSRRPFVNKTEEMKVSVTPPNSAARTPADQDERIAAGDAGAGQIFEQFQNTQKVQVQNDIDLVMDIPVQLTVQLGRTKIAIKNLLQLAQGSVVELDGLAGEPMDVLVNGYLIAQGEVVVVNEKFGIRLTDIITPSERIRKLNR